MLLSRSALLLLPACLLAAAPPAPKVVKLDTQGKGYLPILNGPPETVTMRSGLVALAPGKSVGSHSTGANEEMLVVLEGTGEFRLEQESLALAGGTALYCPPGRTHDVVNTGSTVLRYVYITASTRVAPTPPGLAH